MINIALPKGRLGEKAYKLLKDSGYGCESYSSDSRKLVFRDSANGVSYFWVKPADVAVYVELGAADLGVAGKDVIEEYTPDVYELMDLDMGKCSMCVAARSDFKDDPSRPLRVATKFVNGAKKYFLSAGREIRVIKLNGSIELAPLLGLSDVIFDIVETGATLKENDLQILSKAYDISARLIANKSAYKFKRDGINALLENLVKTVNCECAKGAVKYD